MINNPEHKKQFVWVAALLWLTLPVENTFTLIIEQARGVFPPDGDTIAIPLFQGGLLLLVLSPIYAFFLWLAARDYQGGRRLFSFDAAKPVQSALWSLLLGGAATLAAASATQSLWLIEPLDAAEALAWAYLLLCLRSSLAGTRPAVSKAIMAQREMGR